MAKICIEIINCSECPLVKCKPTPTGDWFEDATDYYCSVNNKQIAGYIERDWEMPNIPDWCPNLMR